MPEVAGRLNEVWILAGTVAMTAGTGAKALGVDNSTFSKLCTILEIPQFGDSYMKRIVGMKDNTFSISGNFYVGDTTGQDIMIAGNSVYIGTMPSGPTVAGSQIPVIIESFEVSADATGKQTFSASFASNGAPVALPIRT